MRKNDSRSAVVRRHLRLRKHISGTAQRPRLNVFRSLNNIYVQVIDDVAGKTLVSCSTLDPQIKGQLSELDKKGAGNAITLILLNKLGEAKPVRMDKQKLLTMIEDAYGC